MVDGQPGRFGAHACTRWRARRRTHPARAVRTACAMYQRQEGGGGVVAVRPPPMFGKKNDDKGGGWGGGGTAQRLCRRGLGCVRRGTGACLRYHPAAGGGAAAAAAAAEAVAAAVASRPAPPPRWRVPHRTRRGGCHGSARRGRRATGERQAGGEEGGGGVLGGRGKRARRPGRWRRSLGWGVGASWGRWCSHSWESQRPPPASPLVSSLPGKKAQTSRS